MSPVRLAALAMCACAAPAIAAAQIPIREGNWEVTAQVEVAGMPMKMPDVKDTRCLTRDMLKDPSAAVPSASPDSNNDCKVSDYKAIGNKASWKMVCTQPMPISGVGEITYAGDSYDGAMTMSTGAVDIATKFKGKRLGDCTK